METTYRRRAVVTYFAIARYNKPFLDLFDAIVTLRRKVIPRGRYTVYRIHGKRFEYPLYYRSFG